MGFAEIIWIIPLLPIIGFMVSLFLGSRYSKFSSGLATAIMGICVLASFYSIILVSGSGPISIEKIWYVTETFKISMGFLADGLSAMMLAVVSLVSFLVHIYSHEYMRGDNRFWIFYAELQLFSASMLGLVLAHNYLQLYICWELVGLCSYLLIGFWYERDAVSNAGKKAFLVTRIGDAGMMAGILLLFINAKTLVFKEVFNIAASGQISDGLITAIAILLFCGAVGKSAQFPLHVWLPDAMEGPTPVSALIHAATMVAAGVYMVGRSFPLFSESPRAMLIVAVIGTFTAIFAATIAVVQTDIKKVLAYSTISQLGYMIFALGIGAYTAGLFHLMTHAFFKSLLFLGAGSIIHSTHTQDITEMGGLAKKMKITAATFIAGGLSLSGFPLLAGFWSKDEILGFAFESGRYWIFIVGAFTAFLTAFYMFRLIFIVFFGKTGKAVERAHESSKIITTPLIILSIFAAFIGFVGAPFINSNYGIAKFISGGLEVHHFEFNFIPMLISILLGFAGIALAFLMYGKKYIKGEKIFKHIRFYYMLLKNKYYIDEFNDIAIVRPIIRLSGLVNNFDRVVVDGLVNLAGRATVIVSKGVHLFDKGIIDGLVNRTAGETYNSGKRLRFIQTGNISNYAIVMFAVLAVYILYVIFRAIFRWF